MFHDIIRDAIISKRSITARSAEGPRHMSPHALGKDNHGADAMVCFQYAGADDHGLDSAPHWYCLHLDNLQDIKLNDDPWVRGPGDPPRDHIVSIEVWNF